MVTAGAGGVAVILVSPRVSENVGAAARVMKNFGLGDLRVVAPRDWDEERARRMARDGADVLASRRVVETLPEALADLTLVAATTARLGDDRAPVACDPDEGARRLLAAPGPAGIVFGPEERGLTNRELDLCQLAVTIPANPAFSSLNLAQAVAVTCYELSRQAAGADLQRAAPPADAPPPAPGADVERLMQDARDFLLTAGFLNPQNPDAVLLHLRRMLARAAPSTRDVAVLRGIMRQVRWYAGGGTKSDD